MKTCLHMLSRTVISLGPTTRHLMHLSLITRRWPLWLQYW